MRAKAYMLFMTYLACLVIFAHASEDSPSSEESSAEEDIPEDPESLPYEVEQELLSLRKLNNRSLSLSVGAQNAFLPRRFDARKKWKECAKLIQAIWDQGNCRSSSVVATASMAADRLCIATGGSIRTTLSAQYLMACSSSCDRNELISTPLEFLKENGIPSGGPYTADNSTRLGCVPFEVAPCEHDYGNSSMEEPSLEPCDYRKGFASFLCPENCTNDRYTKPLEDDIHKMNSIYEIDEYEEELMKKEIFDNGPIVAGFVLFEDFLNYKKGVYRHKGYGPYIRIQTVKLIGWGVEKKVPYWLGVNSFGETWGMNGLFKFYRGNNHLFIETMVAAGRF